jgi:amino acid transporter
MLIAFTFSELSTMLPLAGSLARFTQFSHGSWVSFCMSWLAWLSCVSVAPTEVQAILQYLTHYLPWLTDASGGVALLTGRGFSVACVLLLLISSMNIMGIKALIRYNSAMAIWKIVIPTFVALTLIYNHFSWHNFTDYHGIMPMGLHGVLWALPSAGIIFSFLGFREATSLAGEAKNPQRAIPIAVIGSVLLVTLLYVLIQVAFLGALTPSSLAHGWGHISFVGSTGPFAGIAETLGLGWLMLLIYVDAGITPLGTAMIYTATTSRLSYAMGENRYVPQFLTKLNQKGVPVFAVFFNFIVGLFLFLPFQGWQALVSFQSVAIVLAYAAGPVSLLALRTQAPTLRRPFLLPWVKPFSALTFYVCNLLIYWTGWAIIWRLMISIVIGFILLALYQYTQGRSKNRLKNQSVDQKAALWLLPYFLGIAIISYLGNFGGGLGLLTFGWDFAVIGVFSTIMLIFAYRSRLPTSLTQEMLGKLEDAE